MGHQRRSQWHIRPSCLCLAITLLIPVLWLAVMSGLESAGKDGLAMTLGWLTIPIVFAAVPAGLVLSLVLALTGRKRK
jgi:hypothetical protein